MFTVVLDYLRFRKIEDRAVLKHRRAGDCQGEGTFTVDFINSGLLPCLYLFGKQRIGSYRVLVRAGERVLNVAFIHRYDNRGGSVLVPAVAVDLYRYLMVFRRLDDCRCVNRR